ncbi:MAG: RagB/SusD family nutrient uptake outer membrane protein [Bacteroidales bacterium]|nr:RagB/SusD family nutrient uptake outer membrane protein [Bacteroidales bacterium]
MKKYIIITLILFVCGSCELDMDRIDTGGDEGPESVFSDKVKSRNALNHLYGSMRFRSGFAIFGWYAMLDGATDNGCYAADIDGAVHFNMSTMTPENQPFASHTPWKDYYRAIRSANIFLKYIDQSPLTAEEIAEMKVEARFLRALYYCELFKMYGALVIMPDEPLEKIEFSEDLKRSSLSETVDSIVAELDAVIPSLKVKTEWGETEYGRVTKGMAMAYKSRVLLHYASPLNTKGESTAEIIKRWEAAAKAAKDVIDLNMYSLHPNYVELFHTRQNEEVILSYLRGPGKEAYTLNLHTSLLPNGAISGIRPTFNLIDGYAMMDGQLPVLGYNSDHTPILNPSVTNYDDNNPFANRDPRLSMNILHHGDSIYMNSRYLVLDMEAVIPPTESKANQKNSFFIQKYQDPSFDHMASGGIDQNVPILRYAEVLLNFAEASNQAYGPNTDAINAINEVRLRAGADPISTDVGDWTKETLNEHIVVERRMEFFAEEFRLWDAKRWLRGPEMLGATIYGGDIVNGRYERYVIEKRIFKEKFYRFPIPLTDVFNSDHRIYQNPGW